MFMWANPVWYELMECDEAEARNNQWWATIDPADVAKVKSASETAAAQHIEFSVTYRHIGLKTGKRSRVHVQAWPLVVGNPEPGEPVLYLGAIKVIGDDDALEH